MAMTQTDAVTQDEEQLVVFTLENESYGVSIEAVNTIIRLPDITYVPKAPTFVKGVMNLRGVIVPVICLRSRFGLPVRESTKATRVIVVEHDTLLVGLIVDAVTETRHIALTQIEQLSSIVVSVDARYLRRVGKVDDRLIILLDLDKVFEREEIDSMTALRQQGADNTTDFAVSR